MYKYATIIGSREISKIEQKLLKEIARVLHDYGYTLRSGGADGADSIVNSFKNVEIFIPWNGFNNLYHDNKRIFQLNKLPDTELAKSKMLSLHPAPSKLSDGATLLHTRNIYQIIGVNGKDGIPSDIVFYAADQDESMNPVGGTRTAVVYAKQLNVPCVNIRFILDKTGSEKHTYEYIKIILQALRINHCGE